MRSVDLKNILTDEQLSELQNGCLDEENDEYYSINSYLNDIKNENKEQILLEKQEKRRKHKEGKEEDTQRKEEENKTHYIRLSVDRMKKAFPNSLFALDTADKIKEWFSELENDPQAGLYELEEFVENMANTLCAVTNENGEIPEYYYGYKGFNVYQLNRETYIYYLLELIYRFYCSYKFRENEVADIFVRFAPLFDKQSETYDKPQIEKYHEVIKND